MATTNSWAKGAEGYFYYNGSTMLVENFSVVEDTPGVTILNIGTTAGIAGSAGVAKYSGSFDGTVIVAGSSYSQLPLFETTNNINPTSAVFSLSSDRHWKGDIIITNRTITVASETPAKFSGSWMGCDGFKFTQTS